MFPCPADTEHYRERSVRTRDLMTILGTVQIKYRVFCHEDTGCPGKKVTTHDSVVLSESCLVPDSCLPVNNFKSQEQRLLLLSVYQNIIQTNYQVLKLFSVKCHITNFFCNNVLLKLSFRLSSIIFTSDVGFLCSLMYNCNCIKGNNNIHQHKTNGFFVTLLSAMNYVNGFPLSC